KEFHDYDRKKCKRMRHVFYRPYEELSDNQNWYLKRYLGMSNYLKRAYQLKEAYRYWFEESKTLGDNDLMGIKQRLYQFYEHLNYIIAILKTLIIKSKSLSAMHLDFVALIVLDYVYYFIISIKK